MREYEPQYDAEKLKELILYVADRSRDDLNFGAVKLNKILYYADFYAYRRLGHPITGAEYQKLQVRRELLRDELIAIEHRQVFNHVQERVVPKSRYRQSVLTDEELTLADEV